LVWVVNPLVAQAISVVLQQQTTRVVVARVAARAEPPPRRARLPVFLVVVLLQVMPMRRLLVHRRAFRAAALPLMLPQPPARQLACRAVWVRLQQLQLLLVRRLALVLVVLKRARADVVVPRRLLARLPVFLAVVPLQVTPMRRPRARLVVYRAAVPPLTLQRLPVHRLVCRAVLARPQQRQLLSVRQQALVFPMLKAVVAVAPRRVLAPSRPGDRARSAG